MTRVGPSYKRYKFPSPSKPQNSLMKIIVIVIIILTRYLVCFIRTEAILCFLHGLSLLAFTPTYVAALLIFPSYRWGNQAQSSEVMCSGSRSWQVVYHGDWDPGSVSPGPTLLTSTPGADHNTCPALAPLAAKLSWPYSCTESLLLWWSCSMRRRWYSPKG